MSDVLLMPRSLLTPFFLKNVVCRYKKVFYISDNNDMSKVNGLIAVSAKKTVEIIRSEITGSQCFVVSPEYCFTTLTSCQEFIYDNVKYAISPFFELVIGHLKATTLIPRVNYESEPFEILSADEYSPTEIFRIYLRRLEQFGDSAQHTARLLRHDVLVKKELHRLLTLQFYLMSMQNCGVTEYDVLLIKVLEQKKSLIGLLGDKHA